VNFHENPPLVAALLHPDGRTDRQTDSTKLIITFYDFVNAPENSQTESGSVICIPNVVRAA